MSWSVFPCFHSYCVNLLCRFLDKSALLILPIIITPVSHCMREYACEVFVCICQCVFFFVNVAKIMKKIIAYMECSAPRIALHMRRYKSYVLTYLLRMNHFQSIDGRSLFLLTDLGNPKKNVYSEINIILFYRFYIKATRFTRAMLSTVIPNSESICSILLNTNVNELCCILCYIFFYIHRDYFCASKL